MSTPRRSPRERGTGAPHAHGFTLVEVLVALAIVAVAMAASVRAVGMMAGNNALLRDKSLAMLAAENQMAELRLEEAFPNVGRDSRPCPQGQLSLVCERRFSSSMNASFRQVTIRVHPAAEPGNTLAQLSGLLGRVQ